MRSEVLEVRLCARGPAMEPNGLRLPCRDPVAFARTFAATLELPIEDSPAPLAGGGIDFTATDPDGNRLTFGTAGAAK